ncbi:MAG: PAS domain S-box protein [Proteobacteria bacterium]|nr:PAS domain S-box protein [Pseudomonadota bacterium]
MSQRPLYSRSVGTVLALALVLVTTVILFGFGVYNYRTYSDRASGELGEHAQRVANRLAKGTALAMWNMDIQQVREALLSEMAAQPVQSLLIREPNGQAILFGMGRDASWNPVDITEAPTNGEATYARAIISHQGQLLGVIEAGITRRFVQEELRRLVWTSAASTLIVELVIVAILFLVITLLVIQPLAAMQRYAKAVGSGDLSCQEISGVFLGEFGAVKTYLEEMVRSLSASLEDSRRKSLEVAESERRYRSVIQNMQDVYFRTDEAGGLVMLSPSGLRMYGAQSMDELLGKPVEMFYMLTPEREAFRDKLQAEGAVRDFEVAFLRKDGNVLQAAVTASFYRDEAGKALGVEGIFRDITERKRAEQDLANAKAILEAAFEQNPVPMVLVTMPDGNIRIVNGACREFLGIEDEPISLGLPLEKAHFSWQDYAPDGRPVPIEEMPLIRAMAGETTNNELYRVVRKDGQTRWELVCGAPIYGADGSIIAAFIAFPDITERKQAEEALRQSEEKFSRIFEMAPECISFVRLRDSMRIDANAAFEIITGYSREEAIGRSANDLCIWDDRERRREFLARLEADGNVRDFEFMLRRKDGALRRVVSSAQLVPIAGEQCYINVIHDITDERRIQELLIQSEKMMSVGSLAAGIAHEINNPLGIVHQAVQNLILRTNPGQKKNQAAAAALGLEMDKLQGYFKARKIDVFLADIQAAALRSSNIIRSMLNFSRRSESKRQVCDLHRIIEQSVLLASSDYDLKKAYDFKRIGIVQDLEVELPVCSCTETEIEQVLLNLLRNAAQAMAMANPPTPDPRIEIRLRAGKDCVRIEVADNGPGMDLETQRKVLEPFFTTKPPGVGTGLGLSVSYFIVTKGHGGRLWLTSALGQGTTFFIELPTDEEKSRQS